MAGRFSVEAVFKAVDKMTAPISRMQNRVGRFTRAMGSQFDRLNRNVDKFAAGVRRGALAVTAGLALSTGAMANVISTGADFEQTLVSAAAKFPGEIRRGTAAFEQLELAARQTGATTEFTASQAASALNFLAMAGFDAEASVAALPGVVDLATAAQVDLATATDIASDTLGAFGLMSKDATQLGTNLARVNDVIAKTTTSSNTTVERLFDTIREGAPVATSAGASLETFAALAGELANSGIKGGQAGTVLKNMFVRLQAPTGAAARVLNRLGIQTKDASGNMLDIVDILGQFNNATKNMGSTQKAAALQAVFGMEAIAGVNILLESGTDRLNEYRTELEGASGASSTMASVMRDTLQGRLNSLNSAVEGVKISIFSMTEGPLSDAIEKTTEWVRANEQLIATNVGEFLAGIINNFENIVKWAKRIGIGLAVFFTLATILKTLVLIMTAVNLVMAANPITWIVLGIVALIAAIAAAIIYWDEIKAAMVSFAQAVTEKVVGAFNWLWEMFTNLPGVVQIAIGALLGPIGALAAAARLIYENWEPITGFFGDLWGGVVNIFNGALDKITGIVDLVKGKAAAIVDTISSIGSGVASFFGFGGDDEEETNQGATGPQIVSPQDRVARSIEEQRTTSTAEVTIRDETGRAEVTGGQLGPGLALANSGAF
jgi:TP901 family phage tail tape measure protein